MTIITDKGGLSETSSAPIILKELTVKNLVKLINFYIKNRIQLKKIQTNNFNNKKLLLSNEVNKIDLIKNFQPFLYNYSKNIPLRILHISNFDEKNNYRLFNISISNKLSNGFIKNNHNVINFCYRNFYTKNRFNLLKENLDKKILDINHNYRPNLIILGHFNDLKRETMFQLKRNYKSKIFMWYEDALSNLAKGPDWNSNLNETEYKYFEKNKKLHTIGLIAQNVRQYYPEVVELGSNGYYRLDYTKLNSVLVEAIKEQQLFIEDIDKELEYIESKLK
jgi:hypothetical protein